MFQLALTRTLNLQLKILPLNNFLCQTKTESNTQVVQCTSYAIKRKVYICIISTTHIISKGT